MLKSYQSYIVGIGHCMEPQQKSNKSINTYVENTKYRTIWVSVTQ